MLAGPHVLQLLEIKHRTDYCSWNCLHQLVSVQICMYTVFHCLTPRTCIVLCLGVCRWKPGSLSWVIHRFLLVLETSTPDVLLVALPALASLGFYLKNQYHQLLPYLSRLLARDRCKGRDDQWIEVQRATLRTIRILVQQLNVADSACALVSVQNMEIEDGSFLRTSYPCN